MSHRSQRGRIPLGVPFYSYYRGLNVVDANHTHVACQLAHSIPMRQRIAGQHPDWPECLFCRLHHTPAPFTEATAPAPDPA